MVKNKFGKLIKSRTISFIEVLIGNYNKIGLNELEALIIAKLYYLSLEDNNQSFDVIASSMTINENELAEKIVELEKLGYLDIETNKYSLDKTIDKLGMVLENSDNQISDRKQDIGEIVSYIESSFQRTITSKDLILINHWLDEKYEVDDIKRAVLKTMQNGVDNLKYTDAILTNNVKKDEEEDVDPKLKAIIDSMYENRR